MMHLEIKLHHSTTVKKKPVSNKIPQPSMVSATSFGKIALDRELTMSVTLIFITKIVKTSDKRSSPVFRCSYYLNMYWDKLSVFLL